ncbi:hypothetical protein T03_7809 [Trichinella britovi]|uniref:Uncharacterized protein n=1 Tax=Trichinella britovi TaxID=45882 RepID=A0A0V1DDR3_TRIBR|nr:hypothetical protein T03_7809 [Trichinella britovi]
MESILTKKMNDMKGTPGRASCCRITPISASVSRQAWANCIFRFHHMKQAGTSADFCMRNLVSMVVSEEYFTFSSFLTIHTVRTHVEQNQLETIGVVEEIRKNMDDFALNVKLLINYAGHLVKSGG